MSSTPDRRPEVVIEEPDPLAPFSPPDKEAAVFEHMPVDAQDVVIRGIFGVNSEYIRIPAKEFLRATPGARIRALRSLRGCDQITLAEEANVRQADISLAERDAKPMNKSVLGKIASVFGTSIGFFLRCTTL